MDTNFEMLDSKGLACLYQVFPVTAGYGFHVNGLVRKENYMSYVCEVENDENDTEIDRYRPKGMIREVIEQDDK